MRFLTGLLALLACLYGVQTAAQGLESEQARTLLGLTGTVDLVRENDGVPGWTVSQGGQIAGYVGSTWEIAQSVGYSGRPIDVLVAVGPDAVIAGAQLLHHNEPVLTLGISERDIAAYVSGFAGHDLKAPFEKGSAGLPDVISRATVSTGVIRDGILRSARALAAGRGLIQTSAGVDRLGWVEADWDALLAMGALVEARMTMSQAAQALSGAKVPVPEGDGDFIHFWAGLVDPPTVGQNLLGQQGYTAAIGSLGPDETVLVVMSRGLQSHRGTQWRRSDTFDRLRVVQGKTVFHPRTSDYIRIDRLRISGAPEMKEISLFRLPPDIDPLQPFEVSVLASRPAVGGDEVSTMLAVQYELPAALRTAPAPEPEPLWRQAWRTDRLAIAITIAMLVLLALVFLGQEWLTHRPVLWRRFRLGYLALTLVVLGWGLGGQLSVVQVIAFLHSLLNGFRWETFLVEPVIFLLWGFVALGLLFWGRGVYCGWLCPFGALQELVNALATRLGIRQIAVPQSLHERLWIVKYTLFVAIVGLSFYSMHDALVLAEAEPFKTAISMRMIRTWPFVLFVLVLLGAGLFIERAYCRYLCPLGAGLAIPAKLKIFDWLHRRPQCGRECRLCQTKCTVGAIDAVGRINPNECVLCLRCQVIMNDCSACPVLKRRARG